MDTLSYSVGMILAQNLQQQGLTEIEGQSLKEGILDVMEADRNAKMDMNQANQVIQQYLAQKNLSQFEENVKEEEVFLKKNREKDGVKELPSGLQYKILEEGDGPIPSATDRVTTHYHGTLLDGTVFDSSVKRGEPATFPVNGVIQGWQEALQLMPVGSKWRLFVPSQMAYGERGAGDLIKPYSMLIFEVELISIN
ncbi:MAG: FKBP-type peptidyl-prolyl cis-trans isomerase [Saprospirales bacterium]|nr:MAG: FKBP-type peptidyl-prolyl cis-trans isomerase [Saprospirales bacterium]